MIAKRFNQVFWGLILGDFVVGGALLGAAVIFDVRVYIFYL